MKASLQKIPLSLIVFLALFTSSANQTIASPMKNNSDLFPTLVPQPNETFPIIDRQFEIDCLRWFSAEAAKSRLILKKSLFSYDAKWGKIWRADFEVVNRKKEIGFVNRAVCWRPAGETGDAIGGLIAFRQPINSL
jgi:hypothetical protein